MSKLLQEAVSEFSKLPGIGRRTALRLAMHLLKMDRESVEQMTDSIARFRRDIRHCEICNNLSDTDRCPICSNPERDRTTICVVEDPRDVAAIERTGEYSGLYHVLHGTISPMDGRGPDQLRVKELLARLADETVTEVIMATNPTVEGDYTALYLSRLLKPLNIKVTRLAYGIPMGGDLEFADEITLYRALEGRRTVE